MVLKYILNTHTRYLAVKERIYYSVFFQLKVYKQRDVKCIHYNKIILYMIHKLIKNIKAFQEIE